MSTLQELTNKFNEQYSKAILTSKVHDWIDTALLGRQIIHKLDECSIIKDSIDFTSIDSIGVIDGN